MLKTIKFVFSDIILLYKNFFSWLFFKTKAFLVTNIFLAIIALPFGLIWLYYVWLNWLDVAKFSNWQLWDSNFLNFLMILLYGLAFLIFNYFYFFLLRYFSKFLEERKKPDFPIFKNFFSFKIFFRYLWLISIILSIFGILIWIFIFCIFYYNWIYWLENAEKNIANSIFSFPSILAFSTIFFGFYLFYKIIFSFAFLIEENTKIFESIKKSFSNTKWFKKFVKTAFVTLVLLTLYFPFYSIKTSLETDYKNIIDYANFVQTWQVKDTEKNYFLQLRHKFKNMSNEDLQKKYQATAFLIAYPNNFINFFSVLYFILFWWIVPLAYLSIFNNIINKK